MYQDYPRYKHGGDKTIRSAIGRLIRPVEMFGTDFCQWTSMHGFSHISMPRRHWIERLLWACVMATAIWGAVNISLGQWQRYRDNPTVVTLEKDFRTWNFSYPAVTVCYENRVNPVKLPAVIKETWNAVPGDQKYDYYSKFVAVVANSDLFHLEGYQEFKDDQSLDVDLFKLAVGVMPDLDLKLAIWSNGGNPGWFPVMTESGVCYVTDSLAIADSVLTKLHPNDTKMFPMSCQYASLICYISIEITTDIDFYFHSPYDVVDITLPPNRIFKTLNRAVELSVMETRSGKGVRGLSPERRHCLYTDEPTQPGRLVYSTNSCRLSCRNKLAVKLCGCKPFYYFYDEGPPCTPAGLACLSAHAAQLRNNGGVRCACGQQCADSVFKEVSRDDQYWKGLLASQGAIRVMVQAPRTRYTREIVFHFQDLVVSFGGAAGLFLGASFISFVEIFYFVFSRFLGTFVGLEPKVEAVKVKYPRVPYEITRIEKLTSILQYQNKYVNK